MKRISLALLSLSLSVYAQAESFYEINASPFATNDAPLPAYVKTAGEKLILIDPHQHFWGAYSAKGKLVRWGIATTGANWCRDIERSCRTKTGNFRIYSLGDESCASKKFPIPNGGAPMPYCMYFTNGQAIHGAYDVELDNASHGCVRVHIDDAEWLRYHFVEGPAVNNHYQGTQVIIKPY